MGNSVDFDQLALPDPEANCSEFTLFKKEYFWVLQKKVDVFNS